MAANEQVRQLLAELGPLVDDIDVVEQEGDSHWDIGFGDGTVLTVDFEPEARKFTLAIEVGIPEDDYRPQFYETLLAYNYLSKDTGGVLMAIDGPAGTIVQMLDVFQMDLDPVTLSGIIQTFLAKANQWKKIVSLTADAALSDPIAEVESAIRV